MTSLWPGEGVRGGGAAKWGGRGGSWGGAVKSVVILSMHGQRLVRFDLQVAVTAIQLVLWPLAHSNLPG